jgi:hypothetical protein
MPVGAPVVADAADGTLGRVGRPGLPIVNRIGAALGCGASSTLGLVSLPASSTSRRSIVPRLLVRFRLFFLSFVVFLSCISWQS